MNNLNSLGNQPVSSNVQSQESNLSQTGNLNGYTVSSSIEDSISVPVNPLTLQSSDLERADQEGTPILQGEDSFPEFEDDDFFGDDDLGEAFSGFSSNDQIVSEKSEEKSANEAIKETSQAESQSSDKTIESLVNSFQATLDAKSLQMKTNRLPDAVLSLSFPAEDMAEILTKILKPQGLAAAFEQIADVKSDRLADSKLSTSLSTEDADQIPVKHLTSEASAAEIEQIIEPFIEKAVNNAVWITPNGKRTPLNAEEKEEVRNQFREAIKTFLIENSFIWDIPDTSKPKDEKEEVTSSIRILVYYTPERQIFSEERPVQIIVKLSDIVKEILKGAIDKVQESDRTQRADRERQEQLADDILKMVIKSGILKRQIMKGEIKQQELKIVVNKELFIPLKALVKIKRVAYKADHHLKLSIDSVEMDLPGQHKMRQMGSGVAAAAA